MITLPANKFLGAWSNLIAYTQIANTAEEGQVGRFVNSFQDISVENGDGKVIRSADLLDVEDLSGTSTILTTKKPDVAEQYLPVENYKVIQMTLNKYLMRNAFVEETQLADFTGYLLSIMRTSKIAFLSQELIKTLEAYEPTQATQTVTVLTIDTSSLTDPMQLESANRYNANAIQKAVISKLNAMGFPTSKYNDAELTEIIDFSSLKWIVRGSTNGNLLVDSLATLLNSNKITDAQKWSETYVIPDEQFTTLDNTIVGFLMHNKKVQFGYFYEIATSFFDASTLNEQDFLHFAYYLGIVSALPAIVVKINPSITPSALQ